jgi:hypothetical protein
VYGVSTGGALVLEAAASGVPGVAKLAVYEVPYNVSEDAGATVARLRRPGEDGDR